MRKEIIALLGDIGRCISETYLRIRHYELMHKALKESRALVRRGLKREDVLLSKSDALEQRVERYASVNKALGDLIANERPYSEFPVLVIDSYDAGSVFYQNEKAEEIEGLNFRDILRQIKPEVRTKQTINILSNNYGCYVDSLDINGSPVYVLKLTPPRKLNS
jgi:hypothetical protein